MKCGMIIMLGFLILSMFVLSLKKYVGETVNVYGWYGIMPSELFADFEKETGIKVIYDVYDNNDMLEAKLLATNSGYDVVVPSFIPYAARQCAMGTYSKLNRDDIPNWKNIEGDVTEHFRKAGGDTDYLIPLFWGTVGIAYDAGVVSRVFQNKEKMSYDTILNPDKLCRLAKFGVSFPEEYIDIFPQTHVYLKLAGDRMKSPDDIRAYGEHFKKIRKYIKKFSSSTMINDLICGEVVAAIGSSDNSWRAKNAARKIGRDIRYVIPEGVGVLWIDCVGIPAKAPHKKNAHKFVNYLLRRDVAAKITNRSGILTNIPSARGFFDQDIVGDDQICPSDVSKLIIGSPSRSAEELQFEKMATRAWSQIRMGVQ